MSTSDAPSALSTGAGLADSNAFNSSSLIASELISVPVIPLSVFEADAVANAYTDPAMSNGAVTSAIFFHFLLIKNSSVLYRHLLQTFEQEKIRMSAARFFDTIRNGTRKVESHDGNDEPFDIGTLL
jgi:hypothetical protein